MRPKRSSACRLNLAVNRRILFLQTPISRPLLNMRWEAFSLIRAKCVRRVRAFLSKKKATMNSCPCYARVRRRWWPAISCIRKHGSAHSSHASIWTALQALGHPVVAVDQSPEMLAHVHGATTVCTDIEALALGRRFAGVLLASHLVNVASDTRRLATHL